MPKSLHVHPFLTVTKPVVLRRCERRITKTVPPARRSHLLLVEPCVEARPRRIALRPGSSLRLLLTIASPCQGVFLPLFLQTALSP